MRGILKGIVASNVKTDVSFVYLVYVRWLETELRNPRDKAAATALIWKADAHQGAACSWPRHSEWHVLMLPSYCRAGA